MDENSFDFTPLLWVGLAAGLLIGVAVGGAFVWMFK